MRLFGRRKRVPDAVPTYWTCAVIDRIKRDGDDRPWSPGGDFAAGAATIGGADFGSGGGWQGGPDGAGGGGFGDSGGGPGDSRGGSSCGGSSCGGGSS